MGSLRLFVALDPPDPVRRRVAEVQAALRQAAGRAARDVKWVPVDNLHLTLQFLGAVAEERLGDVVAAVSGAAASSAPLDLELRGTGAFPGTRRARVLWVGLGGDVAGLRALVAELGRRLAPLGFPPEARPFSAHLTLGRARDPRGVIGLADAVARPADPAPPSWRVEEVVLYRSHLSPRGPTYESLSRAPLARVA